MAFAATMEWDVRTTGNANNGGGFDPTSGTPGTDYSQQDAAQIAYTDLVIDGATDTKCTSAGNPFTAAHVGNVINVTGGTGFTVQRVQIMSVAAGAATCDKALGTLGSTGGTGNLGGGLATIAAAVALAVNTNIVHIKAGTHTLTASVTTATHIQFWGYNATHRDGGTKPLVTTATNSTPLFVLGATRHHFRNISFSNTAGTRANGIESSASFSSLSVFDCKFTGFTNAVIENGGSVADAMFCGCEFVANAASNVVFVQLSFRMHFFGCYFRDMSAGSGYAIKQDGSHHFAVSNCIFDTIANVACNPATYCDVYNCTFYACGSCITVSNLIGSVVNNIFYGTTGYSVDTGTANGVMRKNAYNAVGSGLRNGTFYQGSGYDDILLTADPYTDAANGDFSLNSTAGGGAACKDAGFQYS